MPEALNEFSIIEKYFAPLSAPGSFKLQDDAAIFKPNSGSELVITQDACAESIHFFPEDDPLMIAKKAVRVNVSDLVAKGAKPKSISLALGLSDKCGEIWISRFAQGLSEDLAYFDLELSGGDTFKTGGNVVISITAIGEVPAGKYVSRTSASIGDRLFVTGTIGDSALGLQTRLGNLKSNNPEDIAYLNNRYLLPNPRQEYISVIREFATASMDISDGLIGDAAKLANASKKAALVHLKAIPLSSSAANCVSLDANLLEICVTGGDDYEILFTVSPDNLKMLSMMADNLPIGISEIGEIIPGEGVRVLDETGQPIMFERPSYNHGGEIV